MLFRTCSILALLTASTVAAQSDLQTEFRQMAQLLQLKEGSIVADVGAGGGTWTRLLARRVGDSGRVYATEVKSDLVEGLRATYRRTPNVTVLLGSQEDLALPENCCQAVLLRLVYHAFDQPERMRQGLAHSVPCGGRVLIIDFPGGPRGVDPVDLQQVMKAAGFEKVEFIDSWQGQQGIYAALFERKASSAP